MELNIVFIKYYIIFIGIIYSSQVASQNVVAESILSKTDTFINAHRNMCINRPFPCRSLIIPGIMIAYGVTALNSDWLQDWNEELKDEIWNETPHKQVHIDNYLQWAPAAAVFTLNLAGVKGKNGFFDRTIIYGLALGIQSSVVYSIKKISGETRPNGEGTLSFPSGHTANAFAGAEFMRREYKDVSPWYGIGGYAAAAATGLLRIYNNKHWMSDVIAGAAFGILSTDLAYYIYPTIKRMLFNKRAVSTIVLPTYQKGTVGICLVHLF